MTFLENATLSIPALDIGLVEAIQDGLFRILL